LYFAQRLVGRDQAIHDANPKILDHDVELRDELQHDVATFRRLQLERDALLVAIDALERARERPILVIG
jgi:hypothetical protein